MPPGYAPGPTPADADWHGESWLPAATPTQAAPVRVRVRANPNPNPNPNPDQDTHAAKYAAEVAGGASADEDLVAVSDLLAALEEVVDGLSRHG